MNAPLTIRLFGPLQVMVGGEPFPHLRSRKALWLLALMTLRSGRPVSREWIASTLWPDADLSVAFANLRPVIFDLRRAMGDQAYRLRSPDRVTVVLDLEGVEVDVLRFDAAMAKGDHSSAAELYRGALLEGCFEEWVPQERNLREQECAKALQSLGDAAYEAGNWSAAMDRYRRLVVLDPWRDAARRGLMKSLTKAGDINAALQTYRDFANTLRNEGGLSPDEKTTALYNKIRTMAQQGSRPATLDAPKPSEPRVVGHLLHAPTRLFGREDERLQVADKLRSHRLVTLLGPGGIGKTRLATEIARETAAEYPDGVWLVSLEALNDERSVVGHVLASLDIKLPEGRAALPTLTDALCAKRPLLVLDNCEHLASAVAALGSHLLRECGDLCLLATSREALNILGERVWPVPTLATPDPQHLPSTPTARLRVLSSYESIALFIDRAQAVQPSFELNEGNAAAVAEICARLEGLPLAIELAAARIKAMTVEQVSQRLSDHLRLLGGESRREVGRHQTLRSAIDWSYELLGDRERLLFQRLSIFAGGWTLEAAESVCVGGEIEEEDVSELHAQLADKSMVRFDERQGRFRFLETVRQYAEEKLSRSGEADLVSQRHRACYLTLAEVAEPMMAGAESVAWLSRLRPELGNFRRAIDAGDGAPLEALRLTSALLPLWNVRNQHEEGRRLLSRALALEGAQAPTWERAKALQAMAEIVFASAARDDRVVKQSALEEALRIYQTLEDGDQIARSLSNLGRFALTHGETPVAGDYFERALALRQTHIDRQEEARIRLHQGCLASSLFKLDVSREAFDDALRLFQGEGNLRGCADVLRLIGEHDYMRGNFADARARNEEALRLYRYAEDRHRIHWTLDRLCRAMMEVGPYDAIEELQEECLQIGREGGLTGSLVVALISVTLDSLRSGKIDRAEAAIREAVDLVSNSTNRWVFSEVKEVQGAVLEVRGKNAEAETCYLESLRIRHGNSDRFRILDSLERVARLRAGSDPRRSATLLGAVERLREEIGAPRRPTRRPAVEETITLARLALGEAGLASTLAEGCRMGWQRAADYALAPARN